MTDQASVSPYKAISGVLAEHCDARVVSPGAPGTVFEALDDLRHAGAPSEHVEMAERVSTTLHRLHWAVRHRDEPRRQLLTGQLQTLWHQWLDLSVPARTPRTHPLEAA